MKTPYTLLTAVVSLLFLSSCAIQELRWTEERLLGTWQFERVRYRERGDIGRDNVTEEYNHLIFNLYDDFSLEVMDKEGTFERNGTWTLSTGTVSTGDGSASVDVLVLAYPDGAGGVETLVLNELTVFRNRLCGTDTRDFGYYWYEMERR